VVIGVAAVVCMVAVGAARERVAQIRQHGHQSGARVGKVRYRADRRAHAPAVSEEDAWAIQREISVDAAAPFSTSRVGLIYRNRTDHGSQRDAGVPAGSGVTSSPAARSPGTSDAAAKVIV
jgi:hypothetical protein